VETPITLLNAVLHKRASGTDKPSQSTILAGRATVDIAAGTVLNMGGHHHDVTGVQAVLLGRSDAPDDIAPLYLAAHATAARNIKAGELLLMGDIEQYNDELHRAWQTGLQSA